MNKEQAKKYFNAIRFNDDLSYGSLRTLKMIEDGFFKNLRELEELRSKFYQA
jgi:hypothetical protein